MSKEYNLNKKFTVTLKLDLTLKSITDHFPNLEGLVFDLLKDNFIVQEVAEEIVGSLEKEHFINNTSFDLITVNISKANVLKIESNE